MYQYFFPEITFLQKCFSFTYVGSSLLESLILGKTNFKWQEEFALDNA